MKALTPEIPPSTEAPRSSRLPMTLLIGFFVLISGFLLPMLPWFKQVWEITTTPATKYAPGFTVEKFQQITVGDSTASVLATLGLPERACALDTEHKYGPIRFDPSAANIHAWDDVPGYRLFLEYSVQNHYLKDWWRDDVYLEMGASGRDNQRIGDGIESLQPGKTSVASLN
jgi:hypothetical protein